MIKITIKDDFTKGGGKLERILDEKSYRFTSSEFARIVALVKDMVHKQYDRGVNPDGVSLAPLKPSTIAKKGHSKLFYDTGTLMNNSILSRMNSNTSAEIYIGSQRNKIATYLQYGTSRMVSRPAFGVGKLINDALDKLLNEILEKKVNAL